MLLIQTFSSTAEQAQKVYYTVDLMDDGEPQVMFSGAIYRLQTTIDYLAPFVKGHFIYQINQVLQNGIAYSVAITDLDTKEDVTALYVGPFKSWD